MRVSIVRRVGGAYGYITDGFISALRSKGHTVQRWDGQEASWRAFDPDVHIAASGHREPIPASRRAKVAIHVNPYGPVDLGTINESKDAISWTIAQKPDCVYGYGWTDDTILWKYWQEKHSIPWVPMATAGDKVIFNQSPDESNKSLDLVYVGGRWAYKGISIDAYLLPILQGSYKVHGWGEWPGSYCSGNIADDKVASFLNSGKIGPCISEPHTQKYGIDVPERMFKVALCGTLVLHDPVPGLQKFMPSVVMADSPAKFKELYNYYTRPENAAERIRVAAKQKEEVLGSHTYHHRMSTLLSALGFHQEAAGMLD